MSSEIKKMHRVWNRLLIDSRNSTETPRVNFEEIISSVFATGLFYYFVIDFYDMSVSNMSPGFASAHGIDSDKIKDINDILSLIHPDDIEFVSKAEEKAGAFMYGKIGAEKLLTYKVSYNFRCKMANGQYELFNHQALVLTVDEKNNFIKSLNIMTNINHLAKNNNYKLSLIGLGGEPSYLNLDVFDNQEVVDTALLKPFSTREVEIIKLISEGMTNAEIAEKLFITLNTVKNHRKNILRKSGCKNFGQLITKCVTGGLI